MALLPIGDNYTMGPEDAAAALDLLRPRLAVPMHYNTWPVIAQDPARFASLAAAGGHAVQVLAPGARIFTAWPPAAASAAKRAGSCAITGQVL